jgi:hypothetical protein
VSGLQSWITIREKWDREDSESLGRSLQSSEVTRHRGRDVNVFVFSAQNEPSSINLKMR